MPVFSSCVFDGSLSRAPNSVKVRGQASQDSSDGGPVCVDFRVPASPLHRRPLHRRPSPQRPDFQLLVACLWASAGPFPMQIILFATLVHFPRLQAPTQAQIRGIVDSLVNLRRGWKAALWAKWGLIVATERVSPGVQGCPCVGLLGHSAAPHTKPAHTWHGVLPQGQPPHLPEPCPASGRGETG